MDGRRERTQCPRRYDDRGVNSAPIDARSRGASQVLNHNQVALHKHSACRRLAVGSLNTRSAPVRSAIQGRNRGILRHSNAWKIKCNGIRHGNQGLTRLTSSSPLHIKTMKAHSRLRRLYTPLHPSVFPESEIVTSAPNPPFVNQAPQNLVMGRENTALLTP